MTSLLVICLGLYLSVWREQIWWFVLVSVFLLWPVFLLLRCLVVISICYQNTLCWFGKELKKIKAVKTICVSQVQRNSLACGTVSLINLLSSPPAITPHPPPPRKFTPWKTPRLQNDSVFCKILKLIFTLVAIFYRLYNVHFHTIQSGNAIEGDC